MADTSRGGMAQSTPGVFPATSTGGTGNVIFCRIGKDGEFVFDVHQTPSKCRMDTPGMGLLRGNIDSF
jgi:hypothetical protein